MECYGHCDACYRGDADYEQQRQYRCTFPLFREGDWYGVDTAPHDYMGLPPEHAANGDVEEFPQEPMADGCPGGWYRCEFVQSLHQYFRNGTLDNPLLARCDDTLVLEAVAYYEQQCARAREFLSGQ